MRGTIRQRALNFVVGNHMKPMRFVDAWEDDQAYYGRFENPFHIGRYTLKTFPKSNNQKMELEIGKAMAELQFQADGRELPV